MARMTKISKENLLVADRLMIEQSDSNGWYYVKVYRKGMMSYLSDSKGPILYYTTKDARWSVKRIRPDLEPTTI